MSDHPSSRRRFEHGLSIDCVLSSYRLVALLSSPSNASLLTIFSALSPDLLDQRKCFPNLQYVMNRPAAGGGPRLILGRRRWYTPTHVTPAITKPNLSHSGRIPDKHDDAISTPTHQRCTQGRAWPTSCATYGPWSYIVRRARSLSCIDRAHIPPAER